LAKAIKLRANGKINLVLDVISKRLDGYHDVEMIMQSVGLYDLVTISETVEGIRLSSNWQSIPIDECNIAYKAARLIIDRTGINCGADIYLHKNIPVAAGLGGGSADAAAVLIGLNRLWGLGLSETELLDMALSLGADVPFFVSGGTAIARGIGEKLVPITPLKDVLILIVKPDFGVSTAEAYSLIDLYKISRRPDIKRLTDALRDKDLSEIGKSLCNVLEQVVCGMHSEISVIKQRMMELKALGSIMTGSGPSVYGVFDDLTQAERAYGAFKEAYNQVYLTHTTETSIDIIEELGQ